MGGGCSVRGAGGGAFPGALHSGTCSVEMDLGGKGEEEGKGGDRVMG